MRYLPCARVMRSQLVTGKEHLKVVQRADCRLLGRDKLPSREVPGSMLLARMERGQLPHLRQDDGHAPGPMPFSVNLAAIPVYNYIYLNSLHLRQDDDHTPDPMPLTSPYRCIPITHLYLYMGLHAKVQL